MLPPYSLTKEEGLSYYFTTDYGLEYVVYFMDYSFMFGEYLPPYIPVYTFNIELIAEARVLSKATDKRIEATVSAILRLFFEEIENVMVYICDNLDNKHHARKRKFDSWYSNAINSQIEKYEFVAITEDYELLNSVLLHTQNPFKLQVLSAFKMLNESGFSPL